MPKTKDELLAMSVEEMTEYVLKQQDIKKTMTDEQAALKTQLSEAKTSLESFQAKIKEEEANSQKETLKARFKGQNIKDKFIEDVISKGGFTVDMDDSAFAEGLSKTLDKYPEYKDLPETATTAEEIKATELYSESYKDIIKKAQNKK